MASNTTQQQQQQHFGQSRSHLPSNQIPFCPTSNRKRGYSRVPPRSWHALSRGCDRKRNDGATMTPWSRRRSLAWVFTCVNRLAASHMASGNGEGPFVASEPEEKKRKHYCEIPECCAFEPIAIETLGGIGDSSWTFLNDLARKIEAQTDEKK